VCRGVGCRWQRAALVVASLVSDQSTREATLTHPVCEIVLLRLCQLLQADLKDVAAAAAKVGAPSCVVSSSNRRSACRDISRLLACRPLERCREIPRLGDVFCIPVRCANVFKTLSLLVKERPNRKPVAAWRNAGTHICMSLSIPMRVCFWEAATELLKRLAGGLVCDLVVVAWTEVTRGSGAQHDSGTGGAHTVAGRRVSGRRCHNSQEYDVRFRYLSTCELGSCGVHGRSCFARVLTSCASSTGVWDRLKQQSDTMFKVSRWQI
jgi:hypothetical protein